MIIGIMCLKSITHNMLGSSVQQVRTLTKVPNLAKSRPLVVLENQAFNLEAGKPALNMVLLNALKNTDGSLKLAPQTSHDSALNKIREE
jgi:hypothetical protein